MRISVELVRTLVVLPTYNEKETIERVLASARTALPEAQILVVDDSSPDGTAEIVERTALQLGSVNLLSRPVKNGLGPAYRAGFAWGLGRGFEAFVEMDSDLSHDPASLPRLVGPLAEGFDLVIGSRYVDGGEIVNWKLHRRLLSRGGNVYADLLLGLGVKDSTAGFRAYRAALFEQIDLASVHADGYGFQIEMTYRARRAGARILEVPIRFVDRAEGRSKMSRAVVAEAMWLVTKWGAQRAWRHPAPVRVPAPVWAPATERPEPGVPEAGVPEPGVPEAGVPEAELAGTGLPDMERPATELPGAGQPATELPATGQPSGVPPRFGPGAVLGPGLGGGAASASDPHLGGPGLGGGLSGGPAASEGGLRAAPDEGSSPGSGASS